MKVLSEGQSITLLMIIAGLGTRLSSFPGLAREGIISLEGIAEKRAHLKWEPGESSPDRHNACVRKHGNSPWQQSRAEQRLFHS